MKSKFIVVAAVLFLGFALSECGHAAGIEEVLSKAKKEGKIVMLEVGSTGCVPCERMKPVMERLRRDYDGRLEVVFVDIRKEQNAARRLGVFAIPTQLFFDRKGKVFHRHLGFYGYEEITAVLKKAGL